MQQLSNRALRRWCCSSAVAPRVAIRHVARSAAPFIEYTDRRVGESELRFLNETRAILAPGCWRDPHASRLWRYHLHYFQDLQGRTAANRVGWHATLIDRWIEENPPFGGDGWDSYPISLRSMSWIKWSIARRPLSERAQASLALQLDHLSRRLEFHLLGNHLLENAKALAIGGCYFAGKAADRWRSRGLRLYLQQLDEQILGDGGHFERSPMYHALALEGVLDVINVFDSYAFTCPPGLRQTAKKMLSWQGVMAHPDGQIVLFNDAAFDEAPAPQLLEQYGRRLGIEVSPSPRGLCHLSDSGYLAARHGAAALYFDAASIGPDYLPAHAHADTLTVELSLHGNRVLVDTGTSTYECGLQRSLERSTAAHNTVSVDAQNSSDVWHAFRVGRRARAEILSVAEELAGIVIEARHDGFAHLRSRAVHKRTIRLSVSGMTVVDNVEGRSEATVETSWHLHPDFVPEPDGSNLFSIYDLKGRRICTIECGANCSVRREPFKYAPEFGKRIPGWRLVLSISGKLPASLETRFTWTP
jgi:uncharacterized heparinase superfamily protein